MADYVEEIKDLLKGPTTNKDEERILEILEKEVPKGTEFDSLIRGLKRKKLYGVSLLRKCFSDINGSQYDEFLETLSSKVGANDNRIDVIYILLDIATLNPEEEAIINVLKRTERNEFDELFRQLNRRKIDGKTLLKKCFDDIHGRESQYGDFLNVVATKIQKNNNRKTIIQTLMDELWGFTERSKFKALDMSVKSGVNWDYIFGLEEENAIIRLLTNADCNCNKEGKQKKYEDRHWIIDRIGEEEIEKNLINKDQIANFACAVWPNINVLRSREKISFLQLEAYYVIFSDLHMCSAPDEDRHAYFYYNRQLYSDALTHYWDRGYTLIENGDIEDCWNYIKYSLEGLMYGQDFEGWFEDQLEKWWQDTVEDYRGHYKLSKQFYDDGRYVRLRGNHDNIWRDSEYLDKFLREEIPDLDVFECALIKN